MDPDEILKAKDKREKNTQAQRRRRAKIKELQEIQTPLREMPRQRKKRSTRASQAIRKPPPAVTESTPSHQYTPSGSEPLVSMSPHMYCPANQDQGLVDPYFTYDTNPTPGPSVPGLFPELTWPLTSTSTVDQAPSYVVPWSFQEPKSAFNLPIQHTTSTTAPLHDDSPLAGLGSSSSMTSSIGNDPAYSSNLLAFMEIMTKSRAVTEYAAKSEHDIQMHEMETLRAIWDHTPEH